MSSIIVLIPEKSIFCGRIYHRTLSHSQIELQVTSGRTQNSSYLRLNLDQMIFSIYQAPARLFNYLSSQNIVVILSCLYSIKASFIVQSNEQIITLIYLRI
ncbi:hypothetical protein FGO68_gene8276 [Halteria grandinella]|uniref:Uncharacterized protein n=1 Tax=Halteria grandinella TaxID=5974 RepID=A0A8J8NXY1_HALGN|nr:hypothetical protein FGO68_gene8276 [Halteria grandinella]